MGQVITNHVPEFCHSFDYKLKRTELHHNEQMKKNIPHLLNENRFMKGHVYHLNRKNETEINSGSPFIPSNPSKYKFADSSKKEIHGI